MKLPQLSLREMFLLVALAAVGLGWWADQSRIARRMRELDEQREAVNQLTKDVVLAEQRCEQILREWSDLKARDEGRMNPPLPPKLKHTDKDEI